MLYESIYSIKFCKKNNSKQTYWFFLVIIFFFVKHCDINVKPLYVKLHCTFVNVYGSYYVFLIFGQRPMITYKFKAALQFPALWSSKLENHFCESVKVIRFRSKTWISFSKYIYIYIYIYI